MYTLNRAINLKSIYFNKSWLGIDLAFILLALLTTAVLFAGITPSFSSDDYVHLLNNTQFKSINDVLTVFIEPYGREYRPLVRISLWLNHLMSADASAYKLTNLFLHLSVTFFIYRIFISLGFSWPSTILGTAVFALHPIHITSIHFILGRTDLVAAFFYFGTLCLVANWKDSISIKEYVAAGIFFIAALLSKEMSVTLVLMVTGIAFYNQSIKSKKSFATLLVKLSPFFVITLIYLIIRLYMWNKLNTVDVYTNYSPSHLINNYLSWIFALSYPFDLYAAQDLMIENPVIFFSAIAIGGLILIGGLIIGYRRSAEPNKLFWLWVSIIWIFVTLLPISGGNPHRWYLYIPSFGVAILIAAFVGKNAGRMSLTIVLLLLVLYSTEDIRLSSIWNRQSELNLDFLKQIEEHKIYQKEHIYFANIPFGFKGAYLFTHSSLQEAIQYHFGRSPKIVSLSYLNLGDQTQVTSLASENSVQFKMMPNHYEFFLLSASDRRFEAPETRHKEDVTIQINALEKNKKISDYSITIKEAAKEDFYYFDGKKIRSAANL